ncbi:MAG TPA: response regulator transcription factor [Steroidobacteraceae bacterium]|nr:response regulator transcription factor [Steroidobacteraceae bacterium]
MRRVRILIADDHEVVRRGIAAQISQRPDWEVIAEATNGRDAVRLALRLEPTLIVLDLSMPELNGLAAASQIVAALPEARVLILTVHDSEQVVREVLAAGARGYVLKSDAGRILMAALDTLLAGGSFFTPKVGKMVVAGYLRNPASPEEPGAAALSAREREVVQLLAEGKSNKEVAAALGITVETAETHRGNIMRKGGFGSLADLVRYAIRNRIIEP